MSKLFAVQCDQWEPIWNSQLIGKYKVKSVLLGKTYDGPPQSKLLLHRVNSSVVNVTNESPIETVN